MFEMEMDCDKTSETEKDFSKQPVQGKVGTGRINDTIFVLHDCFSF